jgi:SAM-dependent methyltransferase
MNSADLNPEFGLYSAYYDLLYRDKDYVAEADYVTESLSRFVPEQAHMLELGCGTGIHASLLAHKGFHVTGVERSESMFKQALIRADSLELSGCPGSFLPKLSAAQDFRTDEEFDAVISLFHVLSYQTDSESIDRFFEAVVRHLKPGGVFLFDVWYGPAVLVQQPSVRVKRMQNEHLEVVRVAEPSLLSDRNSVQVDYQIFVRQKQEIFFREIRERHLMRYFFLPELVQLTNRHNLKIVRAEEWMSANSLSDRTWSALFLCQRGG